MHIFPAIDLKQDQDGRCRCVRLEQGRAEAEQQFSDDPPGVARRWKSGGARWLHVVDLDGAFAGYPANADAIAAIANVVGIDIQVGGGIRDAQAAELYLEDIAVTRVVVGTRALRDPQWLTALCKTYPGQIVAGIDARGGRVAVEGWVRDSGVDAVEAARQVADCGVAAIVFTDIASDGTLAGPNIAATERLLQAVTVPVIASGGVATLDDVRRLAGLPLEGVIIGKALYTGAVNLSEAISLALKPGR